MKVENEVISTCFQVFQGSWYSFIKSSRTKMIIFEYPKDIEGILGDWSIDYLWSIFGK